MHGRTFDSLTPAGGSYGWWFFHRFLFGIGDNLLTYTPSTPIIPCGPTGPSGPCITKRSKPIRLLMQDLHFAIRYQTIYYRFAHVTRITSFSKVAFCALHEKITCLLLTGQDVTTEWVCRKRCCRIFYLQHLLDHHQVRRHHHYQVHQPGLEDQCYLLCPEKSGNMLNISKHNPLPRDNAPFSIYLLSKNTQHAFGSRLSRRTLQKGRP